MQLCHYGDSKLPLGVCVWIVIRLHSPLQKYCNGKASTFVVVVHLNLNLGLRSKDGYEMKPEFTLHLIFSYI